MIPNQITRINRMKTVLIGLAVGFFGYNILCEQAKAAPQITGDIHFIGTATASGASPGSPVIIGFSNDWQVDDLLLPTGDYAVVPALTGVTFNTFSFTGDGAGAMLVAPTIPEWSFLFNNILYSFDLTSLTNGHVTVANGVVMDFTGLGTLHATGFADTPATWALSGTGPNVNFIVAEAHNTAVPEGGVISLLALGFGIFGGKSLLGRRRSV